MQSFIMIFLWMSYCFVSCTEPAIDNIRVRNGIRKLQHHSRNNVNDKTKWRQLITGEIVAPRAKSSSFVKKSYGLSSGSFKSTNSRFHNTRDLQDCKRCNQSMQIMHAPYLHISSSDVIAPFYGTDRSSRHSVGKINGISIPWKRMMKFPKTRVEYRPKGFKTRVNGNSNEVAFAPNVSKLNSTHLSPYQQQRQHNIYKKQFQTPVSFSSSRTQGHDAVKPSLYYNPWDPFGLLNNPKLQFWKSIFPNLFAPQPQLLVSTTLKPARGVNLQERLKLPTKSSISPNQKLGLCCRKQKLSTSCQNLCNYDTFTDRSLVSAVITNQCPGYELESAFNCATSGADHSACCKKNGIGEYRNGYCMVFCTTHLGMPHNTLKYIDCLKVFDRIKNCYREYHVVNPNIYGDL